MSLSDPIGDMLARIKNAQMRAHKIVKMPSSKFKVKIAEVLKNEGFIKDHKIIDENKVDSLIKKLKVQKEICFDTETSSLDIQSAKLAGIAFSCEAVSYTHLRAHETG